MHPLYYVSCLPSESTIITDHYVHVSKGLTCRYPNDRRQFSPVPPYPSSQASASSTAVNPHNAAEDGHPPPNNFPPVFFLDHLVFQQFQVEIPKPISSIPPNVSQLLGNPEKWELIATEYFETAHTWMPIISKKNFCEYITAEKQSVLSSHYFIFTESSTSFGTWDESPSSLRTLFKAVFDISPHCRALSLAYTIVSLNKILFLSCTKLSG